MPAPSGGSGAKAGRLLLARAALDELQSNPALVAVCAAVEQPVRHLLDGEDLVGRPVAAAPPVQVKDRVQRGTASRAERTRADDNVGRVGDVAEQDVVRVVSAAAEERLALQQLLE